MTGEMTLDRLMIAAPGSGSGKTMVTCGLLTALKKMRSVAAFKCGPDYIDPMFHRQALGIPSCNLDTFLVGDAAVPALMAASARSHQADLALVEGVMGYYDGLGGFSDRASSYDVARVTKTPVILLVDVKGMSLSAAALVRGFTAFRKDHGICGILLNRASPMIYERMKQAVEAETGIPVLGYVPVTKAIDFPSRHLGLMRPEELSDLKEGLESLAERLKETVDLPALLAAAKAAPPLLYAADLYPEAAPGALKGLRIGLAEDEAFCFYYEENLQLLKKAGAVLVPFSPIHDRYLPEDLDGLYMGGGYPELYGEGLSANQSMKKDVLAALEGGMPCIAECGAYMYLQSQMEDESGRGWDMTGFFEGRAFPCGHLVHFGYAHVTMEEDSVLGKAGLSLPVHEFHYWDVDGETFAASAKKPAGGRTWRCMQVKKETAAGFPHLYFPAEPAMVTHFLDRCRAFREKRA